MEPQQTRDDDEPVGLEGHVAVFFQDSTLWPVLFVLTAACVSFGSAILLFGVVERNPFALGALAVLSWVSVDLVVRERRRGRFGLVSGSVVVLWLLSAGATVFFVRMTGG